MNEFLKIFLNLSSEPTIRKLWSEHFDNFSTIVPDRGFGEAHTTQTAQTAQPKSAPKTFSTVQEYDAEIARLTKLRDELKNREKKVYYDKIAEREKEIERMRKEIEDFKKRLN